MRKNFIVAVWIHKSIYIFKRVSGIADIKNKTEMRNIPVNPKTPTVQLDLIASEFHERN